jgi:hypothetical protein
MGILEVFVVSLQLGLQFRIGQFPRSSSRCYCFLDVISNDGFFYLFAAVAMFRFDYRIASRSIADGIDVVGCGSIRAGTY